MNDSFFRCGENMNINSRRRVPFLRYKCTLVPEQFARRHNYRCRSHCPHSPKCDPNDRTPCSCIYCLRGSPPHNQQNDDCECLICENPWTNFRRLIDKIETGAPIHCISCASDTGNLMTDTIRQPSQLLCNKCYLYALRFGLCLTCGSLPKLCNNEILFPEKVATVCWCRHALFNQCSDFPKLIYDPDTCRICSKSIRVKSPPNTLITSGLCVPCLDSFIAVGECGLCKHKMRRHYEIICAGYECFGDYFPVELPWANK